MSNTKKSTKTNTAPYLKKGHSSQAAYKAHRDPSKGNFVIPLVLLLVSAFVIIATFYEDEYKNLIADNTTEETTASEEIAETASSNTDADTEVATTQSTDIDTTSTEASESTADASASIDKVAAVSTDTQATEAQVQVVKAIDSETPAQNAEPTVDATPAAITALDDSKVNADKEISIAKKGQNNVPQTMPANVIAKQATYTPNQHSNTQNNRMTYEQARQQAYQQSVARAQAQAKKYDEIIRQRRQTYENEMAARQQHYVTAMKAREEKRAEMAKARKAVFQRVEQNRIETNKKIQKIHNKISSLHDELHQIVNDSRASFRSPAAITTPSSTAEKI